MSRIANEMAKRRQIYRIPKQYYKVLERERVRGKENKLQVEYQSRVIWYIYAGNFSDSSFTAWLQFV